MEKSSFILASKQFFKNDYCYCTFVLLRLKYPEALSDFHPICRPLYVSCVNQSQLRNELDSFSCPVSYCVDGFCKNIALYFSTLGF